ncbi:MAG TPA: hypothetical protein VH592_02745 [Gemmataceae bacterium]
MIVCAAAAMVLSAVLFHFADAWSGEDTSILSAGRQILLETRRADALRSRTEMVVRSLDIKRGIIAELVGGRLSYRQAIIQFQKANELVVNVDLELIPAYRSPSDPEGVGRQVFIWARNTIATWPSDKSQRLLAGFESEFHTMFRGAKLDVEYPVRPVAPVSSGRTETKAAVW